MGKLNWTVLTVLAGGCTARDLTVSMTCRHLATVVEMVDLSLLVGLDVVSIDGVAAAVVKGLPELTSGAAEAWPIKGRTAAAAVKGDCPGERWGGGPGGGPGGV